MPVSLPFEQVDVFSEQPFKGNAVAVVIGADRLSSQQMLEFAAWTQLSETTFLLRPTTAEADYRVRIFTPLRELPFAGHPTLGSCQVWPEPGAAMLRRDRPGVPGGPDPYPPQGRLAVVRGASPASWRSGRRRGVATDRERAWPFPGRYSAANGWTTDPAGSPFGWPRVTRSGHSPGLREARRAQRGRGRALARSPGGGGCGSARLHGRGTQ